MSILGYQVATLSLACVAAASITFTVMRPGPAPKRSGPKVGKATNLSYDWAEGKRKLERIGAAVQLYREAHGYLPVHMRQTVSDAGLPHSITALMKPGHPWTVSQEDMHDVGPRGPKLVPSQSGERGRVLCEYTLPIYFPPFSTSTLLKDRGEELPYFINTNMYTYEELYGGDELPIMVLRLDGRVETVIAVPDDHAGIVRTK